MELTTTISEGGRIVIPSSLREVLGLKTGDKVIIKAKGNKIEIESVMDRFKALQKQLSKHKKKGVSVVDELIRERRAEAKRELADIKKRYD